MWIFNATFFSSLRGKGHFPFSFTSALSRTKKRASAKQLALSPLTADIYVQVRLSSLMRSCVKQQYPRKTLPRDCIPPFVSGLSFSLRRSHSRPRNLWGICLIRRRNVWRKTVESVEKVAPNNKMEVVIWHFFANVTVMQQNIRKIKTKHRNPLNGLDIYTWQICWLAHGSSMSAPDICARNAIVMILSLILLLEQLLVSESGKKQINRIKKNHKINHWTWFSQPCCLLAGAPKASQRSCLPITQVGPANYKEMSSLHVLTSQNWLMPCL